MATSDTNVYDDCPGEFQEDLRKFHLAQVIADRYEKNPQKLGDHYNLNFTPSPSGVVGDDPAEDSAFMIVTEKPQYKSANFGNLLIPKDQKGNYYGETVLKTRLQ